MRLTEEDIVNDALLVGSRLASWELAGCRCGSHYERSVDALRSTSSLWDFKVRWKILRVYNDVDICRYEKD